MYKKFKCWYSLFFSITWISEDYPLKDLATQCTGLEMVRVEMEMVRVLELTAVRQAPHHVVTRLSDSLGWPDGPKGMLVVLGFHFCFSRPAPHYNLWFCQFICGKFNPCNFVLLWNQFFTYKVVLLFSAKWTKNM